MRKRTLKFNQLKKHMLLGAPGGIYQIQHLNPETQEIRLIDTTRHILFKCKIDKISHMEILNENKN